MVKYFPCTELLNSLSSKFVLKNYPFRLYAFKQL